jgi:hypothetical protein
MYKNAIIFFMSKRIDERCNKFLKLLQKKGVIFSRLKETADSSILLSKADYFSQISKIFPPKS